MNDFTEIFLSKNNVNEYPPCTKNCDPEEYSALIITFPAISLKYMFNSHGTSQKAQKFTMIIQIQL